MTALLTDAMLSDICHKNIGVQGATGAVAREVRSIYEARLAEDAKVRAALWVALNSITLNVAGIWKAFEPEIREAVGRSNYSAVFESIDKAAIALTAAKEIK